MKPTDAYLTYQFIKRLNMPFTSWPAYKLGIIDATGKVLRKQHTLKTPQEKAAWGRFDIMVCNVRKVLGKIPGGRTRMAAAAASLYLLKENSFTDADEQRLIDFIHAYEEAIAATNNVGSGNVAGIAGDPPGKQPLKRLKRILKRRDNGTTKKNG